MKNVRDISLIDILNSYFNIKPEELQKVSKNSYSLPCFLHQETKGRSMVIYDKADEGKGWDWVCFGRCKKGGSPAQLLIEAGLFDNMSDAIKDLKEKFHISIPEQMNLDTLAEYKGIPREFLADLGWATNSEGGRTGVVIPFLNEKMEVIAKKKRMNFEASPKYIYLYGENSMYGLHLLPKYDREAPLFLTEGETDCATMLYGGFPTLGIPGANSFDKIAATTDIVEKLNAFSKLVLVGDNDQAGMTLLGVLKKYFPDKIFSLAMPKYYKDVSDFFAYDCASDRDILWDKLSTAELLPSSPEIFTELIKQNPSNITNERYWWAALSGLNNLDKELFLENLKGLDKEIKLSKTYINKVGKSFLIKMGKELEHQSIKIHKNQYVKMIIKPDGDSFSIPISNFIMKLHYTLDTEGELVRVCSLINTQDEESKPLRFDGDTLTKPVEFMVHCKSAGNYIFKGDFNDLISINEIILEQESIIIDSPSYIGRVGRQWVMGTYGVDQTGAVVEANSDNVLEMDMARIMPRSINTLNLEDTSFMPTIPENLKPIAPSYLMNVARTLVKNLGTYNAWIALGSVVSGWYSDAIFNYRGVKAYPMLFIAGKRNSGKTYLARWLMRMCGFGHIDGTSFALPSIISMSRKLGYYSSLPQWYDDYRNDCKDITRRNEFLLGVYNRQGANKATRSSFGIRSDVVRGWLMLSGEDTPDDSAVLSRCVVFQLSAFERDDTEHQNITRLAEDFPRIGLHFMRDRQVNGSEGILRKINEVYKELLEDGRDARSAWNMAVFAGGFLYGFGFGLSEQEIDSFRRFYKGIAATLSEETETTHVVNFFFEELAVLENRGLIKHSDTFRIEGDRVSIWFKAAYDIWVQAYKPVISTKRLTLMNYLKKEKYFVDDNVVKRLAPEINVTRRCVVLDYTKMPEGEFRDMCFRIADEYKLGQNDF